MKRLYRPLILIAALSLLAGFSRGVQQSPLPSVLKGAK